MKETTKSNFIIGQQLKGQPQEPKLPHPVPLQAGRELDGMIAEKVMGWTRGLSSGLSGSSFEFWEQPPGTGRRNMDAEPPHYSTDMTAAWTVFARFGDGSRIEIVYARVNEWHSIIKFWATLVSDGAPHMVTAETAPLAICLAALKAIGEVSS